MTLTADYFDRLYASSDDPWAFRQRWYEERKRALTLAALPLPRYGSVFEPGCSVGELSRAIADRCDRLLACDTSEAAADIAREQLAHHPHVRVERRSLPAEWPEETFDLVVISELGYYFDASDLSLLIGCAVRSLAPNGTLLACHWRPVVHDYPLTGDRVHWLFNQLVPFPRLARHEEKDFLLEVWSRDPRSVAQAEGFA